LTFPAAVPEIPTASVAKAVAYYVETMGFTLDWMSERDGIAGISRGNCRLFLAGPSFRESNGNASPSLFWVNLNSRAEVDDLFTQWKAAGARIVSAPVETPWNIHEFISADLDYNLIRVFYDFGTAPE